MANDCTCQCPDGTGQHLVGCHVYDTPPMTALRDDYEVRADILGRELTRLADGNFSVSQLPQFARNLRTHMRALMIVAGKIAIEDHLNPNGSHGQEPWA